MAKLSRQMPLDRALEYYSNLDAGSSAAEAEGTVKARGQGEPFNNGVTFENFLLLARDLESQPPAGGQ